jgi:sugar lactone lactonase YvrE
VCAASLALAGDAAAADLREVTQFVPPGLPESVEVDVAGNAYVSVPSLRQVSKVSPDGALQTLPPIPIANGTTAGLALDVAGSIYVAVNSSTPGASGVWRIAAGGGSVVQYASIPIGGSLDALAFDRSGRLYVSDSAKGVVWRVAENGPFEPWLEHVMLAGKKPASTPSGTIGASGLAFDVLGNLYIANSDFGRIVRVRVDADGVAGSVETWAEDAALVGADGIAFDVGGNLVVAVNSQHRLVRVTPGRTIQTVATAADGLNFPSDVAIPAPGEGAGVAYVTNFAALLAVRMAPDRHPYHPEYPARFREAPGLLAALQRAIDHAFAGLSPSSRPTPADLLR